MIAALLIIQHVANQSALTSITMGTGGISSFNIASQGGSAGGDHTLPAMYPVCPASNYGKNTGGPEVHGVKVETTIDLHLDSEV